MTDFPITIDEIKKIVLHENDVLLVKVNRNNLPSQKYQEFTETVKSAISAVFPNNNVLIHDDSMNFEVIHPENDNENENGMEEIS
jgi:hypothetical protein